MDIQLEKINRRAFLFAQLELYKIQFTNTGYNKYLEVMNEINKTIKFLDLSFEIIEHQQKIINNAGMKNEVFK